MLSDQQIRQAFQMILAEFPTAGPSLKAASNFQYLVAVILSAQTTDKAVNQVTPQLFQKYPTPPTMAQAKVAEIEPLIKTIGLYHNKARYLVLVHKNYAPILRVKSPQRRNLWSLYQVSVAKRLMWS